ncbi:hypothetical protein POK33_37915 [Burkholderia cenocepacia]|uniref:hypothetical protein n=1 Tax=Burkholderia cenocepacia TaxID=95486 RepID=UPI0023BA1945|nr:hypothetical protein [Burkholderia cenocepacia]MDF0506533.1 hypothetical protein [Burkholderia cenocepacia]
MTRRTPKQAAMGAIMDEHVEIRRHIGELERGEARYLDGSSIPDDRRLVLLGRMRELQAENRAAYDWLNGLHDDGAAGGADNGREPA